MAFGSALGRPAALIVTTFFFSAEVFSSALCDAVFLRKKLPLVPLASDASGTLEL